MVSIDVSNNPWVCKSRCSDVDGSSVRIRGGEWVEVIIIDGVGKRVPEWCSHQISSIVAKRVIGIDSLGFDGVVVTVLIDIKLDVMGFLCASPWHRDIHSVSDMSGIVGVVTLVSQGYWEFRVQDFDLRDRYWRWSVKVGVVGWVREQRLVV